MIPKHLFCVGIVLLGAVFFFTSGFEVALAQDPCANNNTGFGSGFDCVDKIGKDSKIDPVNKDNLAEFLE